MKIQFKGRTIDAVAPAAGTVAEREIVLNTFDGSIYTSSDGTDIIKLGGGGTSTEFGGKAWVAGNAYVIGDVVVESNVAYYCSILNSDAAFTVSNWTAIGLTERGGIVYDPLIQYIAGDIVSYNDIIYIVGATPPPAGTLPTDLSFSDTDPIAPEQGGIAYDNATTYVAGDVVSHVDRVYINTGGSTGAVPTVGGNSDWKDTIVSGTFISTFTPSGGNEYPDAVANGAVKNDFYIIDGLGAGVTYTMAVGDLSGNVVKDGDRFIVGVIPDDGTGTLGNWNYVPGPTIPAERGGIAWKSGTNYVNGDSVSDGGALYLCNTGHTSVTGDNVDGSPTQSNQTNWTDTITAVPVPVKASQLEVDAGTDDTKFVTSLTLETDDKWATKEDALPTQVTAADMVLNRNAGVDTWVTATSGAVKATQAEVDAGTEDTKFVTSLTLETDDKWLTKEDDLSNPTTNGDVLSSTTAGVRTWITPTTTTVNNTLTSTSTTEALSASMGKQLQDTKVTSVAEHGDSTNTAPGTTAILNMVSCTQAQYDAIKGNVGIIPTTVYMITGP